MDTFDMLFGMHDEKTKNEFIEKLKTDVLEYVKEWKENNIYENLKIYEEINDIRDAITDCLIFGRLVDMETGKTYWIYEFLEKLDKVINTITDKKYLEYELKRKEELLKTINNKLIEGVQH